MGYGRVECLTIANPPQYGVVVEGKESLDNSIFHSIYLDALNNVRDIVEYNDKCNKNNIHSISPETLNTVISFVGKRGSGKSTAMCSLADILSNLSSKWAREAFKDYDALNKIYSKNYLALDVIDSAQLGVKETIIGRISAAMYDKYQQMNICGKCFASAEKKRDLIKKLSDVNKYAVMYHTGEWFKNNESLLSDTHHISSLRNQMSQLVKAFLRFMSDKNDVSDEYIVICVDDLDMGIENSYAIMEEIRKFLCIPNIIVLVTLRMDQVHVALKAKFEQQLGWKIDNSNDKTLIDDLAYRYAEKLFPYSRQHQMPILSCGQLTKLKADFEIEKVSKSNDAASVLNTILYLIWRKTLIIPICNSNGEHFLVPCNLRSLCNFVVFLRGLPDIALKEGKKINYADTDDDHKKLITNNLRSFSQYLVGNIRSFEQEYISKEDRDFAEELISIIHKIEYVPIMDMNSCIVGDILYYLQTQQEKSYYYRIFAEINVPVGGNDTELKVLLDACMHPETISLGDLMFVLGKIDSKTRCRFIKYLIEVIRTLWSARMTEIYYRMDAGWDDTFYGVVGNLIVNPDVGFFNSRNSDMCGMNDSELNNKLISESKIFLGVSSARSNDPKWRLTRNQNLGDSDNVLVHPLAPLTNSEYRTIIPFFSFDYVYRLYETLHTKVANCDKFLDKLQDLYTEKKISIAISDITKKHEDIGITYIKNEKESALDSQLFDILNRIAIVISKEDFISKLDKCVSYSEIVQLTNEIDEYDIMEKAKAILRDIPQEQVDNQQLGAIKLKIMKVI